MFQDENSDLNPYYPRFKSHQLDIVDEDQSFIITYSRQGMVELKTSSQDQALKL